jgi:hypothetical protein
MASAKPEPTTNRHNQPKAVAREGAERQARIGAQRLDVAPRPVVAGRGI